MNGLKYMLCPIYNNKKCLSKPGLRIMKIVTENSTGQFITNCMRQHFNAKCDTAYYKLRQVYYKLRRFLYMIFFKVLKLISNHFNFQLQTINELDKLYTKTDMYCFESLIIHSVCSQICISSGAPNDRFLGNDLKQLVMHPGVL